MNTPDATTTPAPAAPTTGPDTVVLDEPIQRGDTRITALALRRPRAGELRGLNLAEVLQLNATALHQLLPRITVPSLTSHEVEQLDPADLVELGARVAVFFVRRNIRSEFPST
jgi:hypothetical protein